MNVNIDLGALHLDALRTAGRTERRSEPIEAEYEIEDFGNLYRHHPTNQYLERLAQNEALTKVA